MQTAQLGISASKWLSLPSGTHRRCFCDKARCTTLRLLLSRQLHAAAQLRSKLRCWLYCRGVVLDVMHAHPPHQPAPALPQGRL